ncbi:MAG: beta-ketoacyl synthase chain length factor [Chitinophagaceae bacterium]|nr:beta-ketoacyl synthase chain length factor [Chitinophagaceae bacterium]
MFYIHKTTCISPQQTFSAVDIEHLNEPVNNKFQAVEPSYEGIPPGILRRMGKAVRLGVGAAMPLVHHSTQPPDGIIIGTSMGGLEDCIKFLNQVIEYNEGMLTPTNFVQSTSNAIAGQLGLLSKNKGYNITHVHRGFSFENAILDAAMLLKETPGTNYLIGGVDEISSYNYNIEYLGGWYKKEIFSSKDLYTPGSVASIAGEGAAMFLVNDQSTGAEAQLKAIHIFQTEDIATVGNQLRQFLEKNLPAGEKPDLLLSGENGDSRFLKYYTTCETLTGNDITIARFKHMMGEYPTVSSVAVWLACEIIKQNALPQHMLKSKSPDRDFKNILIYNNYKGLQHSMMLVSKAENQ